MQPSGLAHQPAGTVVTVAGQPLDRMIEMADPHRLAEHLDHVEVAIGVERVAGIVAGEGELMPRARISWTSVRPRRRGVRPAARSCR